MKHLQNEEGISILEILAVAIMASVLLVTAIPSLSGSLEAHKLQSSLRAARNYVRVVRATGVARNVSARLDVSVDGKTLRTEIFESGAWTAVGSPVYLDAGATVSNVNPPLVFTAQGTTNAATTLTLSGPGGAAETLTVSILGSVGVS